MAAIKYLNQNTGKQMLLQVLCILTVFLCLTACKKDKHNSKKDEQVKTINGGEILQYGLVTIELKDIVLNKEEYQGKIGDIAVTLMKSGDHELVFLPLESVPAGEQELVIKDLNNLRINYTVKKPVLTQSPDATITPLLEHFSRFTQDRADDTTYNALLLQNLNTIATIYEKATEEQQRIMAITYQANKPMFDQIFSELNDKQSVMTVKPDRNMGVTMFKDPISRISATSQSTVAQRIGKLILLGKFSDYIITMGITGVAAVYAKPYNWHTLVLAGVSLACAIKSYETWEEIAGIMWHNVGVKFDRIMDGVSAQQHRFLEPAIISSQGTSHTSNSTSLSLYHDKYTSVPFYLEGRRLQSSDAQSTLPLFQTFFKDFSELNSITTKINNALTWCNDNIPFSNFTLIRTETMPQSSKPEAIGVPSDILKYLSFSVNDKNLELTDVSLTEAGALNIKAKIIGTEETKIQGVLKYVYKDDISSFEGNVPIEVVRVEELDLTGVWKATEVYRKSAGPLNLAGKNLLNYFYSYNYFDMLQDTPFKNCSPLMVEQRLDEYMLHFATNGKMVESQKGHSAGVGVGSFSKCADFQNAYTKGAYDKSNEYTYSYNAEKRTLSLVNSSGQTSVFVVSTIDGQLVLEISSPANFNYDKIVLSKQVN